MESKSVYLASLQMASGNPGNPAPVPTSITVLLLSKTIYLRGKRESNTINSLKESLSLMAVKLNFSFASRVLSIKFSERDILLSSMPLIKLRTFVFNSSLVIFLSLFYM